MAMTRKDYQAVARVLAENPGENCDQIAAELAKTFAEGNPRFDRDRFLRAAGVDEAPQDR